MSDGKQFGKVLVLNSGGAKSKQCMDLARDNAEEVITLTFRTHTDSLEQAAEAIKGVISGYRVCDLRGLMRPLSGSERRPLSIATMLCVAGNHAAELGCDAICIGVTQGTDNPEHSADFISKMEEALNLGASDKPGMGATIWTPLLNCSPDEFDNERP